jgi:hypothetical protein
MVKIRKYSMPEALKRLRNGETLYNIEQNLEIMHNGKPGSRKSVFNYDIITLKGGEFEYGFSEEFISEYIRRGGFEECLKQLNDDSAKGSKSSYTVSDLIEIKKDFGCIHSRVEPAYRPMTQFEMMGWANSEESRGWLVRMIDKNDKSKWLLPQQLRYDCNEGLNHVSYERAKLLPDCSDIDKTTIRQFKTQDTNFIFYSVSDRRQRETDAARGIER